MNKKLLSIAMALLLAAAPLSLAASADEDTAAEQGVKGTIKFDMGDWNHEDDVCFYIYSKNAEGTVRHYSPNGPQEGDNWGSKKIVGTPVEGQDGIVESYEVEFEDGWDYYVIFNDKNTNAETYGCIVTADAIGKTAKMTGNLIENPVDSEKQSIEADFEGVDGCGPVKQITSTGNVVGKVFPSNGVAAKEVAQYMFNQIGKYDAKSEPCVTKEKVISAAMQLGTTADEVVAAFQSFAGQEGYEEKAAAVMALFEETQPPVQTPEEPEGIKGTFFFDMGDWNHEDDVCFYIYSKNAEGTVRHYSPNGPQEGDNWASKKIIGTPVEGQDGIVESYEIEFEDGWEYYVIFNDRVTNAETYGCIVTADAIGKTAKMTDNFIENPVDSERQSREVVFEGAEGCGPVKQITSTGNVVGTIMPANTVGEKVVAKYIYDRIGKFDNKGEDCCSREKVVKAMEAYKTSADKVWAEFQKFANEADYADKETPAHDVLFPSAQPDRQLGDVDGDGKVSGKDALIIQRYTINLTTLDDVQLAAADVNADGKVSGKDAMKIQRITLKLDKIAPEPSRMQLNKTE